MERECPFDPEFYEIIWSEELEVEYNKIIEELKNDKNVRPSVMGWMEIRLGDTGYQLGHLFSPCNFFEITFKSKAEEARNKWLLQKYG